MEKIFFYLFLFSSILSVAQTQQNINKNTGTVSNAISTIDSIRFTGSSTTMEVVLQNGTIESHPISDILNVNFITANQDSCDATNVFNPNLSYGSMTDQEGNVYKTIVIGSQEWMAENLNTSIYRNGDPIATNLTVAEWANTLNTQIGAWVFYNNDSQYECFYGKLYNWFAVADPRHVCPTGWHEPTDGELIILTDYLGGAVVAGGKMKSTGTQYWLNPNLDATNESGFSALPAGGRAGFGDFFDLGSYGSCWSSTESNTSSSWFLYMNYNFGLAIRNEFNKRDGFSVRCLRD
jgi:uncharacterized protein (TIGR02145 family)